MIISFYIDGKVQAKQRPRLGRYSRYTPAQTKNYENWAKLCFINKYPNFKPLEKALRVNIFAYYEIPKSAGKKRKYDMLNDNIRPTIKPDIDNIAKSILDSLNKIAYLDDKQVVDLEVKKMYAEKPCVYVVIEEINNTEEKQV